MIFKFQQGGAMPPFVSYTPVIIQDRRTLGTGEEESSEKSSKNTGQITEKDALGMIKEMLKGLPSDQSIAMKQIAPLFQGPLSRWDTSSSTSIASKYLKALNTLSTLEFNKDQYDKSLEIAKSKDSLNEAAITSTGYVYCVNVRDKTDFRMMRPEEVVKSKEFRPITNQDLLYMRAYKPELAFNAEVLGVVNSGTSMKEIVQVVKNVTSNLGSSSQDSTLYASAPEGTVVDSLNTIKALLQTQTGKIDPTLQDLYKHNEKSQNQLQQAKHALNWLYSQLSDNQKALLKLKTPNGKSEEVQQLLYEAIAASISDSMTTSWDLVGGPTYKTQSKQSNSGSSKDTTDEKASFLTNLLTRQGASDESPITIDRGDGIQLSVRGSFFNLIPDEKNQEPITNTSVADMLAKSGIQRLATNLHAITFGDQKISIEQLNNVAYLNSGCVRANLPKKEDGTVDLDILERFNQAMDEIKLANKDKKKISQIIAKYKLNSYILPNGAANPKTCGPFIITEGYTNDDVIDAKNSKFIKEKKLTGEQESLINDAINSTRDKKAKKFDISGWFTDTYKAAIYIPITNNLNTALQNSGLDQDEADSLEQKYQEWNRSLNKQSTSSDVLGLKQ